MATTESDFISTDTVSFYVRDPDDNQLLAHWDFEDIATNPVLVDISGNGYNGTASISDPNVAEGVLTLATRCPSSLVVFETRADVVINRHAAIHGGGYEAR